MLEICRDNRLLENVSPSVYVSVLLRLYRSTPSNLMLGNYKNLYEKPRPC